MSKTDNKAAELAANFQVEELEPRLENAWAASDMGGTPATQVPASEGPCPDYDC